MKEKLEEVQSVNQSKVNSIPHQVNEPKMTDFVLDLDRTIVDFSGEI